MTGHSADPPEHRTRRRRRDDFTRHEILAVFNGLIWCGFGLLAGNLWITHCLAQYLRDTNALAVSVVTFILQLLLIGYLLVCAAVSGIMVVMYRRASGRTKSLMVFNYGTVIGLMALAVVVSVL